MSNPHVIRKVEKNIINPADMIDYGNQFVWNMIDKACLPPDFNINAMSYYKDPSTNETTVVVGGNVGGGSDDGKACIAYTTTFGTSDSWTVINGLFEDPGVIISITNNGLGEFIFVGTHTRSDVTKGFAITCDISSFASTFVYKTISFDATPLLSITYNHTNNEYAAVGENGNVYIIKPSTSSESGYIISGGIPILIGFAGTLRFITYDSYNDMYIGCGDNTYIFYGKYSGEDLTWTSYKVIDNSNVSLHSITYDSKQNRYIAVGSNGYMVYNTTNINANNWTRTYMELPAPVTGILNNDLQSVYYSSEFDICVCAGYNDIIGCNRKLDRLWSIDILSVPPSTTYQNIIEHPTFGIIVVGGNSTILYSNKLIRLVRPKATDDILQDVFGIGSIITGTSNEYPANYLWFGSWESEADTEGKRTYVRVDPIIGENSGT